MDHFTAGLKSPPLILKKIQALTEADVEDSRSAGSRRGRANWIHVVCNLRTGKGKEKKEEGAGEFAGHGDEMVANSVWNAIDEVRSS